MPEACEPRDDQGRFVTGNTGGPGRPKGARNKLGEEFLQDLLANWAQHGADTIEKVRAEKPDQYLKVVASILPKELNVKVGELDDLTDDQLQQQYAAVAKALIAAGFGAGAGVAEAQGTQPAPGVSTLQ